VKNLVPNERPLTDMILVDNEPLNIKKLPLDGAYQLVDLTFILNMTNGAAVPVFKEDDILNYFTAVGIRKNGKTFKFSQPLRFAYKKQTSDIGTPAFYQAPLTTINSTYDAIVKYTIYFREFINQVNDVSALLQTKNLTNLELVISTGDVNDIASANAPTINTRTVKIEIRDFTGKGTKGDINDDTQEKMNDISEIVEEIDLESGKTSFKAPQDVDMVAGSNILEHAGLVLDSGLASDSLVTDIRTWNVKPRSSDLESTFLKLNRDSKTDNVLNSRIKGFFKIDWQEKLGRNGFRTSAKSSELIQLLTNGVVAGTDKILVYTKFV